MKVNDIVDKKIRILESVESLGIGGNEMSVMNFFRHLNRDEFQVDFIVYNDKKGFQQEVLEAGSQIFYQPATGNKIIVFFKNMRFVSEVLKKNQYDVIHCNGCSFIGILRAVLPAKVHKNIKIISHSHSVGKSKNNVFDRLMRFFLKRILSKSIDLGFACSDLAGISKYTKKFMNSSQYIIIHNAIDIEKYVFNYNNRKDVRRKYRLEDKIVIGNIGRLSIEKNQRRLIDIFSVIVANNPKVSLMIIGGGQLEKELKCYVHKLGIDQQVIFSGSVMDAEKYYSAMDVFVMPSLYEGLPFTAIEAQANGLRCVFSDSITKMVNVTNEVGFISLDESDDSWARQILKFAERRCQVDSVERVKIDYSLSRETKRLEDYYKFLVEKKE